MPKTKKTEGNQHSSSEMTHPENNPPLQLSNSLSSQQTSQTNTSIPHCPNPSFTYAFSNVYTNQAIEIFVQRLINFHLNAHAPFVLNHILEYISTIPTTCIAAPDVSLKQRVIASHYETTWTLVLNQLSLYLFHK